jgi:hypothetical protein
MITRNIKARFTAAEALEFLKKIHNQLDAKVLARQPTESSIALRNSSWDRWAVLPKDFVKQWSAYRDPPPHLLLPSFAKNLQSRVRMANCLYAEKGGSKHRGFVLPIPEHIAQNLSLLSQGLNLFVI